MKKTTSFFTSPLFRGFLFSIVALLVQSSVYAQWTNTADMENTNSGSVRIKSNLKIGPSYGAGNSAIEWFTSNYSGGFGHKIYNSDPGTGITDLRIAARHGVAAFTDVMTFTSTGKVGIGTPTPIGPLEIVGNNGERTILRNTATTLNTATVFRLKGSTYNGGLDGLEISYYGHNSVDAAWSYYAGGAGASIINLNNAPLVLGTSNKERFTITGSGNILIGKSSQVNSTYKLDVNGGVRANSIVVNTTGADFVFENNYKLKPLSEVESFIQANHHLPEIAPAAEMQKEGVNVGELQTQLLQKIEELTLYMIEQNKRIQALEKQLSEAKK